jgi:hypothetical protein
VVVISDLLFDPDEIADGLSALTRNDVFVAQVLTPEELGPETSGDAIFEDPESDEIRRTYFGATAAKRYGERLRSHLTEVDERCRVLGAEQRLVDTGEDFFETFASLWLGARLDSDRRGQR